MSIYTNSEERNLCIFLLRHPLELLLFLYKSLMFAIAYFSVKISKACMRWVFVIRMKITNLIRRREETSLLLEKLPDIHFQPYGGTLPDPLDIKLATQNIRIETKIKWHHPYADKEDIFALNRFGWALSLSLQYPSPKTAEFALNSILSWIRQMQEPQGGSAWESYSVAERLANWPFILLIAKKFCAISDEARGIIAESMAKQVDYLLNNLELNGIFTNNHILNDARGLYIGGVVLNHDIALRKSRELFNVWTEKVFYPDGMLRDGSSHYQYLLCQRFEQVYYLSCHVKDAPLSGFMERWVRLMRDCCDFFSVYGRDNYWHMPMFGDISPDFSPEWLSPVSKSGWTLLKKWLNWQDLAFSVKNNNMNPKIKGGFLRFDSGNTVIFWHIAQERNAYLNHGHYDLGSFVLFYNGREIFADPGLCSYNEKTMHAKSARAHSTLLIDSFGLSCENHKLNLLNAFPGKNLNSTISQSSGKLGIDMQSEGFKRLPVPVEWKRGFVIDSDKMVIIDSLKSAGDHLAESRFQVSPGLETKEGEGWVKVLLSGDFTITLKVMDSFGYKCGLIRGNDIQSEEGWFCTEYGKSLPGTSVVFRRDLLLDQDHVYEIRW
jgi:hypothetical protein